MSEWIDKADQKVHDLCTRFSHRLQRGTGLTCYFVARIGVGFTALNVVATLINYYFPFLPQPTSMLMLVLSGIILISLIPRSIACQRADDLIGERVKPIDLLMYMEKPFWRILWISCTLAGLMTVPLSVALAKNVSSFTPFTVFIQDIAFSLGNAIFWNFINVTPMPPSTNKVTEWVKGLFAAPRELAHQETK